MRQARHTLTSVTPVADLAADDELPRLQAAALDDWYRIVSGRGWEAVGDPRAVLHAAPHDSAHGESGAGRSWQVTGWVSAPSGGNYRITFAGPDADVTVEDRSVQSGLVKLRLPVLRGFPGRGDERKGYQRALQELLDQVRIVGKRYRSTALAATITAEPVPPSPARAAWVRLGRWQRALADRLPLARSLALPSAEVDDARFPRSADPPSHSHVDTLRAGLQSALAGTEGDASPLEGLCAACVKLLSVGGAAISATVEDALGPSVGASSELCRELDELQFTFGEGPCVDAIRETAPIAVLLANPGARSWPAFTGAALERGVHSVLALPVSVANVPIGSLALYCFDEREVDNELVRGALMAAELATLPLLDLVAQNPASGATPLATWDLASLSRVEVYQATGMLTVQLGVGAPDALARLRAYAFAHDMTASDVGWAIVQRRLRLDDDRSDEPQYRME